MPLDVPADKVLSACTLMVTHRPGALQLARFPLLVFAPEQHGFEVATEDHGIFVSEICRQHALTPDFAAVAAHFGTTAEHVRQALDYALSLLVPVPDPDA